MRSDQCWLLDMGTKCRVFILPCHQLGVLVGNLLPSGPSVEFTHEGLRLVRNYHHGHNPVSTY